MTERTAHETQIFVQLGPITGLCRLCRVCPDRAERGAKGRRKGAWRLMIDHISPSFPFASR